MQRVYIIAAESLLYHPIACDIATRNKNNQACSSRRMVALATAWKISCRDINIGHRQLVCSLLCLDILGSLIIKKRDNRCLRSSCVKRLPFFCRSIGDIIVYSKTRRRKGHNLNTIDSSKGIKTWKGRKRYRSANYRNLVNRCKSFWTSCK